MLQRLREWLVLILIIGLPFHAFLVTVGTRLLAGAGQAPLPWLAGWKEMVLGIVILVAIVEMLIKFRIPVQGLRPLRAEWQNSEFKIDILDCLILGLFALGGLTSIFNFPVQGLSPFRAEWQFSIFNFLYGFKYAFFPLLLFLILRRVPWSERFLLLTSYFLLLVGAVVVGYGILTLFLPESFFTWLGYSDLHSLYLPDGPLAAFQKIEGTGIRRIQSTFSGPNQLGMWLLIPWSAGVMTFVERWGSVMVGPSNHGTRVSHFDGLSVTRWIFLVLIIGIALSLTFSRATWIGAAVILLVSVWLYAPRVRRLLGYSVIGLFGVAVLGAVLFPELFLRAASSREHVRRPLEAIRMIAAHPLGLGLGSAGPASNRTSDPCVFLEEGADVSWAKDRPNLCVFSGVAQVQPAGRVCRCPFLPENWYLQVGVELGVLGLVLYLVLIGGVGYWLFSILNSQFSILTPILLSFIGISVAALFLHAWEDSAVAYTVWILLASVIPVRRRRILH